MRTSSARITRWGDLDKVLGGIDAAQRAGISVKINTVALKGVNEDEIDDLIAWAHGRGMDLTLIEVMPLGEIGGEPRSTSICRCRWCARGLRERYTLEDIDYRTGGPARYVRVAETGGRLGFITPMTHNFCESCNRVRAHLHRHALHVPRPGGCRRPARAVARLGGDDALDAAIDEAIARKPKGHDFIIDRRNARPALSRHMSVTGG